MKLDLPKINKYRKENMRSTINIELNKIPVLQCIKIFQTCKEFNSFGKRLKYWFSFSFLTKFRNDKRKRITEHKESRINIKYKSRN